ncbi:MAG: chloramphenicol phosphotransferase [Mesorhizobium sp.]|uniref:chloramphenicol phosphotransferase CPT family protein n=1 Tax=Mesorhizobium sp. TaxID=1871066 RepID=UPI000FE66BC6|nr:chloramphenicol phosphotransferase [Mesorhizobium sp.]RWN47215.1 MAG: chloramphenicol phosphotransferase [Mesorhizobium sp.]RWO50255.1 MAG: chloramphenicol phosphotransferase [Mesorhizobium sp.]TJV22580.1 MAG: chloramphenicol phosphotransferase [Mesorhizobium sp.]
MAGQVIILNGAPRSGKSSIARAVQERFDGVWINLGVDVYEQATPARYRPGIGLRPGGERPDLEALVPGLYAALYESIAAHSRLGLNVVADVGHHDAYSRPLHIVADCARRLVGLPVLFVGVRCPLEIIMERRAASAADKRYVTGSSDDPVPLPVRLWQEEVHRPGVYDLEVDTSLMSPKQCADTIRRRLEQGIARPSAIEQLAQTATD